MWAPFLKLWAGYGSELRMVVRHQVVAIERKLLCKRLDGPWQEAERGWSW